MSLESFSGNDQANRFYRKNGWTVRGELPDGVAGGARVLFEKRRGSEKSG